MSADVHMRRLSDFANCSRGNVAMLFGLMLVPVFFFAGLGLDMTRRALAAAEMQDAVDASLLRVARLKTEDADATDADLTATARDIFIADTKDVANLAVTQFAVRTAADGESFTVDAKGALPTTLLGAVGIRKLDIDVRSTVKLGERPYIEVAMALDNTGSMNANNKIGALRNAASELINTVFEPSNAGVKVGLVPFAQYVNVGAGNAGAAWLTGAGAGWAGCVGSRSYPLNVEDADETAQKEPALSGVPCPGARILPLTDDKQTALDAVAAMTANGNTYIPAGLSWGWKLLSPGAPFTEGVDKSELDRRGGIKALIVLTDGENTRAPSYPAHNSANKSLADTLTRETCANIKADGVQIYAIAFNVTDPSTRALLEECSSSSAHYFDAGDSQALLDAFRRIGATLRNLSIAS